MSGYVNGRIKHGGSTYKFQAKVFDHGSDHGIGEGKVSYLSIKEEGGLFNLDSFRGEDRWVMHYDRGWKRLPEDRDIGVVKKAKGFLERGRW